MFYSAQGELREAFFAGEAAGQQERYIKIELLHVFKTATDKRPPNREYQLILSSDNTSYDYNYPVDGNGVNRNTDSTRKFDPVEIAVDDKNVIRTIQVSTVNVENQITLYYRVMNKIKTDSPYEQVGDTQTVILAPNQVYEFTMSGKGTNCKTLMLDIGINASFTNGK